MLTKFEMTFPGTPVDPWLGDEEKQGAHMKREARADMRIGKQKERSHNARGSKGEELQFRECRASATSYKNLVSCFMTRILIYHPLIHAEIKCYLGCLSHFLNVFPLNFTFDI